MPRRPPTLELPFFPTPEDAPPITPRSARPFTLTPSPPAIPIPEPAPSALQVISVGELDRRLKRLLEGNTGDVAVEGEVSDLKPAASGHMYFTLKDEREEASIECVMYRTAPPRARRLLGVGARVVLVGRATVYAPRGRLQFTADNARPAGRGALLEALERLKEKLAGEGLFAAERKRQLPTEARVIGVVTSADGAAIHDIVKVAFRRAAVRILLAPAPVQGPDAARLMAKALAVLGRVPEVEAIILGRGGGSADDLAAFNEEVLVRQVAASRVPVVSAVGHEVDMTLTDLAADARAATPSQAAELLVPDAGARLEALAHLRARMARAMAQHVAGERATLERYASSFTSTSALVGERRQTLDDARERLAAALRRRLVERRAEHARLERRLLARHPSAVVAGARASLGPLQVRLAAAARRHLAVLRGRLGDDATRLDALSPLAVLARGYAIASGPSGRPILDASEVRPGDLVRIRVHRGDVRARACGVHDGGDPHTPAAGADDPGDEC